MPSNGDKAASPCSFGLKSGSGLTKREHFAGLAMQGMMANTDKDDIEAHVKGLFLPQMAINAIDAADALLKALENK